MNMRAGTTSDESQVPLRRELQLPGGRWIFTGAHQPRRVPGGLLVMKPVYRWVAKYRCWYCSGPARLGFALAQCPACGCKAEEGQR